MTLFIFIVAVILIGYYTIKLKRRNRENFSNAINQWLNEMPDNTPAFPTAQPVQQPAPVPAQPEQPALPYTPPEDMPLDTAIVPPAADFAEEMELMLYAAKKYPDLFRLELYKPKNIIEIAEFQRRTGIQFTQELQQFYHFTDGFSANIGSMFMYPLDLVERESHNEYEWGNEKDWTVIGDWIGDGEIIVFDRRTNSILTDDHGDITDYGTFTELLDYAMDLFLKGEVEDERIDAFFKDKE